MISESVEMSQSKDMKELEKLVDEQSEMYPLGPTIALAYLSVLKDCEVHCFKEGSEVKRLGGLHVIGTSLHESRRIDNQVNYFCIHFSILLYTCSSYFYQLWGEFRFDMRPSNFSFGVAESSPLFP